MPFRGHEDLSSEYLADPLARFFDLEAAFAERGGLLADRVPMRFAAVNLLLAPGEAGELAGRVDASMGRLWPMRLARPVRMLMASALCKHGDDPEAFVAEVERAREIMSELGFRRELVYRVLTALTLRVRNHFEPITREQLERVKAIYEAMKTHHWLLTGPEDLPACAFLSFREAEPEAIGERANQIYEALREEAGLWRGDPLQTASNVLALSGLEPGELARRFRVLAEAFAAAGKRIRAGDYDEVAALCFLARPVPRIIETVTDYREQIAERLGWSSRSLAFNLAASLAFVRLLGDDPELGPIADAKLLLDMQAIVASRQAAAAAAAAGGR